MPKVDRCVVRNVAYTRGKVANMERHNERKNAHYGNGDIDLGQAHKNIYFKRCDGDYLQAFDKLVGDGAISTRGQKSDAKIIDEFIFDVNSEHFMRFGGYDYAKSFFEETYKLAVKEAGDEEYILSAVMHADERNKALSEKEGHDIFHYHLHVVYVPVVEKEVLWTKRCKDPKLVGTVKERIKQVSHSKRWKSESVVGENGKRQLVYSYSLLQDRYFQHMKEAGFRGFLRGEKGSNAEHLDVLDYKISQDEKRLSRLDGAISTKKETAKNAEDAAAKKEAQVEKLDAGIAKKQERIATLDKSIAIKKHMRANFSDIDAMPHTTLFGKIELTPENWNSVSSMAKKSIKLKEENGQLQEEIDNLRAVFRGLRDDYTKLGNYAKPYADAMRVFPDRVKDFISSVIAEGQNMKEQKRLEAEEQARAAAELRKAKPKKKSYDVEL